jgi:hypothetical protein
MIAIRKTILLPKSLIILQVIIRQIVLNAIISILFPGVVPVLITIFSRSKADMTLMTVKPVTLPAVTQRYQLNA